MTVTGAPSKTTSSDNQLLKDNSNGKSRIVVPSRYLSPSSPRTLTSPLTNRSVSADRRRRDPKPAAVSDSSAASNLLITSSRSLSVSFQGEAFPLPISKIKPTTRRIGTPGTRNSDLLENSRPVDPHRWPARIPLPSEVGSPDSDRTKNGIIVSARFWQETNRRLRRLQDPGSPGPTAKPLPSCRKGIGPAMAKTRGEGEGIRPGMAGRGQSPNRVRSNSCETARVDSYVTTKIGENRMAEGHVLRLLHNRHMQWRFVNARTQSALLLRKRRTEKNLWNAWLTISDLRDVLTKKRHRLQLLRQKLKLVSILKGQMTRLEDWTFIDKDHLISLIEAIDSLKACTLRLPLVGGATANVQSLQDAMSSAVDVMQAMTSSICLLLPLIEEVNSLATELAKVMTRERDLIQRCTEYISRLAVIQVKGCSLRSHILQHSPA